MIISLSVDVAISCISSRVMLFSMLYVASRRQVSVEKCLRTSEFKIWLPETMLSPIVRSSTRAFLFESKEQSALTLWLLLVMRFSILNETSQDR